MRMGSIGMERAWLVCDGGRSRDVPHASSPVIVECKVWDGQRRVRTEPGRNPGSTAKNRKSRPRGSLPFWSSQPVARRRIVVLRALASADEGGCLRSRHAHVGMARRGMVQARGAALHRADDDAIGKPALAARRVIRVMHQGAVVVTRGRCRGATRARVANGPRRMLGRTSAERPRRRAWRPGSP